MATVQDYKKRFFILDQHLQTIQSVGKSLSLEDHQRALDMFFDYFVAFPEYKLLYPSEEMVKVSRPFQLAYWQQFWAGELTEAYIESRKTVGNNYAHLGLPLDTFYLAIATMNQVYEEILREKNLLSTDLLCAYYRLAAMDKSIVIHIHHQSINEVLTAQNEVLMEMSSPIAQLWRGILMLPVVGIIDSKRAKEIMTNMLEKISLTQSRVFILDISGIAVVDTGVANHLIKMTKAAKLMGCNCVISGVSPAVAQTMVELGVQTDDVTTTGIMEDALRIAFTLLKMTVSAGKE